MKAVIWTDVLQSTIMLAGLIVVIIFGGLRVGGIGNVIKLADRGNRTTPMYVYSISLRVCALTWLEIRTVKLHWLILHADLNHSPPANSQLGLILLLVFY